jgi:tetratricopeptide (TPR) repeat protein
LAKPNNIRKKALDHARNRQWDKALIEFNRLIEVERHNPNLFNEIGDLHLKVGDRREAFRSFHDAVDAYSGVGLHNNAVAVCKKILRLNPQDPVVCGKLALLRHRQGFPLEAVSYSLTFLDNLLAAADVPGEKYRELVVEIATAAGDESQVLERAVEYLVKCEFNDAAGSLLDRLDTVYSAAGDTEKRDRVRQRMKSIGHVPSKGLDTHSRDAKLETVESHRSTSDGGVGGLVDSLDGSVPPHVRKGCDDNVGEDFGVIDIGPPAKDGQDGSRPKEQPPVSEGVQTTDVEEMAADPSTIGLPPPTETPAPPPDATDEYEPSEPAKEYVIPVEEPEQETVGEDANVVGSAEIVGEYASEVKADVDEDDHRSHYDLGMAYLEMGLFAEAVREFQFASHSSAYQVRSLEMIGRCFIEQNQPELAIKQLVRGLSHVDGDDSDTLGIKYSLGLAYEMVGEIDKARSCFEDVYVVDVTFRDVEEKINKYVS